MAEESRLSDMLGDGDAAEEAGEVQAATLDAAAAALAMQVAPTNPLLAAEAAAYFRTQARLSGIQAEHLHEQRAVQISFLRLKRLSEGLRVVWQLFVSVAAVLISGYAVSLMADAVMSRAVIVDAFDAPPALTALGLSGQVVAGQLLDRLSIMQRATRSSIANRSLGNSWGNDDLKLEVPETGLSLSDLDRLLRARFGHELHIGGDLVQTPAGGLELTVRGDGVEPRMFAGAATDLHRLSVAAGEYVYGQTQPALFAIYLERAGRSADALAFSKAAVPTVAPAERPFLLNAWAGALSDLGGPAQESLALERAALAAAPDYWTASANAMLYAHDMGDDETAWQIGERMRGIAGGRPGRAPEIDYALWDDITGNQLAARRAAIADAEQHAGIGTDNAAANPIVAGIDIDLHDLDDAKLRLASFDLTDPYAAAMAHYIRGRLAEDHHDPQGALQEYLAWGTANADPAVSAGDTSYHCLIGAAQAAAGHPDRADAEYRAAGHFIDCARWKADDLDRGGDWAGARRGYAAAIALAPDLPAGYFSWGQALARHGDTSGAIAAYDAAHRRGPHWADPLKAWGDVLAATGRPDEARTKYAEALREAPDWRELQAAARR